ncbi:hypothetical protein NR798_07740 [Archangium gephyra]|uniref:hypothetical protein n=1 Tax=Archangium gephyra TaxID=48 RepID=UPI0035D491E6
MAPPALQRQVLLPALVVTSVGLASLALGLNYLQHRFPHEDAYILFRYARNLADGYGIAFNPGGPPAEGATDFLWMVTLAALNALGLDVAVAAVVANALGAALCTGLLLSAVPLRELEPRRHWHLLLAPGVLLVTAAATAAYVGFSSMFYGGVALLTYRLFTARSERVRRLVPVAGLLLALVRPDGVVIGVGMTLLALVRAPPGQRGRFVRVMGVCALVGAGYFVWRATYFGELLPLPLYVKSHAPSPLPGLGENLAWLCQLAAPLVVFLAATLLFLSREGLTDVRPYLLGLAPFALHVALLSLGVPSQNIAMRFQAPALLALLLALQLLLAGPTSAPGGGSARVAFLVALVCACLPQVWLLRDTLVRAPFDPYMDRFSFALGRRLDRGTVVALTEAGRLPFWTEAQVVDLVGLNTRETARKPPTADFLRELAPDLVMFHHDWTLDVSGVRSGPGQDVVAVTGPLRDLVLPQYRPLLTASGKSYDELAVDHVKLAPLVATEFLSQMREAYDVYLVRYLRGYAHVYGVKKGLARREDIPRLLQEAHERGPSSYFALSRSAPPPPQP